MTPEGLPRERLFGEWEKLLVRGREVAKGLRFLDETGWTGFFRTLDRGALAAAGKAVEALGPPERRAEDPALAFVAFCRIAAGGAEDPLVFMRSLTSDARLLGEAEAIAKTADAIAAKAGSEWTDGEVRRLSAEGPVRKALAEAWEAQLDGEFSDLAGWERWLVRKEKGDAMKREAWE